MFELSFILLTFISVFLLYFGTGKDKKVILFFTIWICIIGVLSFVGFFENTKAFPPRIAFGILPSFFYVFYFVKKLPIEKLNLKLLIAIHIIRLPVEIALFELYFQKRIPIIMTFDGWNFDILMGISAILVFIYVYLKKEVVNKGALIVWNIVGICFLTIIVSTALLSAPTPIQQFAFDQPNIGVLAFPFSFLPTIIVPIVLLSHILSLKILIKK